LQPISWWLLPIRICHLISDLDPGGAERSLVNLLTGLDSTRFTSDVVSLVAPGSMAQPLAEAGIPVTGLNMVHGRPNFGSFVALVRHLRRTRPAILQTWLHHSDLAGAIASWFERPDRLIWNVRSSDVTQTPGNSSIRWVMRALAFLSTRPDAVIVNSRQGQLSHQAAGYRPRMWVHIPNGVDADRFRPRPLERSSLRARLGLDPKAKVVGFVSRFHPMKDCPTFFRAAERFCQRHEDARFVVCGWKLTPDNQQLRELIESARLDGRVTVLGVRADMQDIYPAFDLLALSSTYGEGFPNVLIEAMACGVPCVATDVGDSRDIVGELGVIVPPRDPDALAQGWDAMIAREPGPIAEQVRARVIATYSLERMRLRYEELYENIIAGGVRSEQV
jgi:glycosyltransferase involved in cell wall biosynthesis